MEKARTFVTIKTLRKYKERKTTVDDHNRLHRERLITKNYLRKHRERLSKMRSHREKQEYVESEIDLEVAAIQLGGTYPTDCKYVLDSLGML